MAPSRTANNFRPDLEGLRGVAILLVVASHAGVAGMGAGFIGVDVFFVLSGFLITGLLVAEHDRTGSIRLGAFYARRARRILPAAAVVLVATLLAATIVMSPLDMTRIANDGLSAGLSVANFRFALGATDYFSPTDPSPMLHYWSLSVEEQFYLVWPALLIVAMRLGRFSFMPAVVAATVLAWSLVLCVTITPLSSNWAYFLLPTRAWELAAGGLLAIGIRERTLPRAVVVLAGWGGLALIGASLILIEPTTPYPGIAATAPTAGTLGLIVGRNAIGSPGWLILQRSPLRWLGRISYSLYLWHWPVLVLGPSLLASGDIEATPAIDPTVVTAVLIVASVVLAALSWRLIEEPFRAGRLSGGGRRRALAVAAAAVLSVTVASTGLSRVAQNEVTSATIGDAADGTGDFWDETYEPSDAPESSGPPSAWPSNDVVSSPPTSPSVPPSATPSPRPEPLFEGPLPSGLRPSLAAARDDEGRLMRDGCGLAMTGTEPPDCIYGEKDGDVTLALVGDSHAMHWFPAFERLAKWHHWRLVPFTKYSCVFVDMRIWSDYLKREYSECETWRERVIAKLRRLKPDLVVISSNKWFATMAPGDDEPKRQGAGLAALIERIPSPVAILVDTPRSDHDVPACLARNTRAIERCTTARAAAFGWRHRIREVEARKQTGAPLIDMSKLICPTSRDSARCPVIVGRRLVYRDHHHLTATFAISLTRDLDAAVMKILAR